MTCLCAAQSRRERSDKAELLQDVEPLDFSGEEPLETENRRSVLLYHKINALLSVMGTEPELEIMFFS